MISNYIFDWLLVLVVYMSGYFAKSTLVQISNANKADWPELLLGPFGALVITLIVGWLLVKYIRQKDKKINELFDKLIETKDQLIEELKKEKK